MNGLTSTRNQCERLRHRKIIRSCLNCRRSQMRYRKKRLCTQSIKRKNLLECVNSNDKKPAHLNVLKIKSTTLGCRGVAPSLRAIRLQKSPNVDVPQYRSSKTNIQPSPETHVQVQEQTAGSACIDPQLLHIKSPDYAIELDASIRALGEENHNNAASINHLQDSPGNDKQPGPPEQEKRAPRAPKNFSRESSPGCLEIEVLSKQLFKNGEEHNIKIIQDSRGSCGFTISSGWSSTFFPCGLNDESSNDWKIGIAEYSI